MHRSPSVVQVAAPCGRATWHSSSDLVDSGPALPAMPASGIALYCSWGDTRPRHASGDPGAVRIPSSGLVQT